MTIVSPARRARATAATLTVWLAAACGASAATPTTAPATTSDVESTPAAAPSPPATGLDEAQARALLAARFRAAGLRVKYDVRLAGSGYDFTVDGFDPARGVGFEYIDAAESGVDLTADEAEALARDTDNRVLVVVAASAGAVAAAARRFLDDLEP